MNYNRCQICGRRKGLKKNGAIVMHHVQGDRCPGTGHLPIEYSHDALATEIARLRELASEQRAIVREMLAQRVNYIDPRFQRKAYAAEDRADRLARRLKRHLNWPARFARQMERDGWGSPPPAYLVDAI